MPDTEAAKKEVQSKPAPSVRTLIARGQITR